MPERMSGNEYRTTVVCVDEYASDRFEGRIYNPYLAGAAQFQSLMQMLLTVDQLLDEMNFPQSFTANREFRPAPVPAVKGRGQPEKQVGKLATFAVRIIFRQNASWQGSVVWLEGDREESFRSVLELLLLMHSALAQNTGG